MNLLMLFIGGLCALTGAYGLYSGGASLFLIIAMAWGCFMVGYQLKEDVV
jgi:hypothetical protein